MHYTPVSMFAYTLNQQAVAVFHNNPLLEGTSTISFRSFSIPFVSPHVSDTSYIVCARARTCFGSLVRFYTLCNRVSFEMDCFVMVFSTFLMPLCMCCYLEVSFGHYSRQLTLFAF